jgi:glutamyl-tRNA(Gln) amidotransferase subunit D
MYSEKVLKALKQRKIRVGDRVVVKKLGRRTEGLLMPQTGAGDPETLVVKLDNGYNVGIKFKNAGIERSKANGAGSGNAGRKELGKTSRSLTKLKFNAKNPAISIISTGGTIASRIDYNTGGVKALDDPKEFLHNVPELGKIVNVKTIEKPLTKMSEDMEPNDWIEIAKATAKRLNAGDKGVIITHGTDFLHYTAAALSFFLRDLTKPVVLVGAQRSSDRGSSDAGMNLICASHAAIGDIAEVGICMHGRINDDYCLFSRGTHVRKMSTQRRDAFRPINEYPLAKIWPDGKTKIRNRTYTKRNDKSKVKLDTSFEPKVALLKAYPGSDPMIIDHMVSKGYKGFVIEAGGLGHVPTNGRLSWIPTIKKHASAGIPFVTAPQTIYGRINPNVYSNLRALYKDTGAIPGGDMLSEVAYIKLGWVLGHKDAASNPETVREMMLTNYANEISGRSMAGTFLY